MSAPCCQRAVQAEGGSGARRRPATWGGWALSGATLILMPKCPICVATYVALFTGVGLSLQTAARLRTALLIVSGVALVGLSLKLSLARRGRVKEARDRAEAAHRP